MNNSLMQTNASASEQRLQIRPIGKQRLKGELQGRHVVVSMALSMARKKGPVPSLEIKIPHE